MLKKSLMSVLFLTAMLIGQSKSFAENEELTVPSILHENYRKPVRLFDVDVYQKVDIVTGVDVDKLLGHYINDYERFSMSRNSCINSIICRWRVKPDPNDPETRYFWGKKRDTLEYQRTFKLRIGVFESHKEAVKRGILANDSIQTPFDYTLVGNHYALNKLDNYHVALRSFMHVVDNVFVAFTVAPDGWCDEEAILEGIISDIKNGTNGVTRGTVLDIPTVDSSKIPNEITLNKEEEIEFALPYSDPNGLPCVPFIGCNAFDTDKEHPAGYNFIFDWNRETGECTVKNTERVGERTATASIQGAVSNERCVFSDLFYKKSVSVHLIYPTEEPEVDVGSPGLKN